MNALVFNKNKNDWSESIGFELDDIPEPVLDEKKNPSDAVAVIIKVSYAGVCGSDRGMWYRQSFGDLIKGSLEAEKKSSRTIGHEFFGHVIACGSRVSEIVNVAAGDFVSCESHIICNKCYQCLHNQKNVCTNEKILGISTDGCFADVIKVPAHVVWPTDTAKIRPEVAAVQEPFGNAVHAASKVDLRGRSVAIFGLGPIGLFTVLVARGMGASTIIGIEPNPVSQEMARQLGIDYVIPVSFVEKEKSFLHDASVVASMMSLTDGLGVDVTFEMAGFNSSVNNAILSTRRGGDVILFGIKSGNFCLENYDRLIVSGLTLHSVIGREVFATWEYTKKLLEHAENRIQERIFSVILNSGNGTILPLREYTKVRFEKMMNEHPKILLQM